VHTEISSKADDRMDGKVKGTPWQEAFIAHPGGGYRRLNIQE
jgi:hypothetical protein